MAKLLQALAPGCNFRVVDATLSRVVDATLSRVVVNETFTVQAHLAGILVLTKDWTVVKYSASSGMLTIGTIH